jgi:hypothetical protein
VKSSKTDRAHQANKKRTGEKGEERGGRTGPGRSVPSAAASVEIPVAAEARHVGRSVRMGPTALPRI